MENANIRGASNELATKARIISSPADLAEILRKAKAAASNVLEELLQLRSGEEALKSLWRLKVETVGCDPLNSERPLNFIEQINQTFTYVASARAVKKLFEIHGDTAAPFTLNLGTMRGSDIESSSLGGIAAEVFAAVNTSNNSKLQKDIKKVSKRTDVRHKYAFFMCPGVNPGPRADKNKHDVQVWSLGHDLDL